MAEYVGKGVPINVPEAKGSLLVVGNDIKIHLGVEAIKK